MTKARVDIEGNSVVFRPVGMAKAWAFQSEVFVPITEITAVRTTNDLRTVMWGVRWCGTEWPGAIRAGWMGWPWRRAWWCVGRGRPVLVVDTPELKIKRIVVSTDDPFRVAELLRAAVDARV